MQKELEHRNVEPRVRNEAKRSVTRGILLKYNLTIERLWISRQMVAQKRWKQQLEQIVSEDNPLYVVIDGEYWDRINKVLKRNERTIILDDIHERWDLLAQWRCGKSQEEIDRDTQRVFNSCHAMVMDPEQSKESGWWAFKNSYGDGTFRVDDDLMHELMSKEQLFFYEGKRM